MKDQWYSIEEIGVILKLHPKTVLRFIHEGKISARKIGRSWRITREALEAYAHGELRAADKVPDTVDYATIPARMTVSAILEIRDQSPEESSRLSNTLMAALNGKDPAWGASRADCFYYPETRTGKYALYGSPAFIATILDMFSRLSAPEGGNRE